MLVVKVSDTLAQRIGATNPQEFLSRVESLLDKAESGTNEVVADNTDALLSAITEIGATVEDLHSIVSKAKPEQSAMSQEDVIRIATTVASKITAGALASTGTNPAPIGVVTSNPDVKPTLAEDDYEGQWKASEQLRGEFGGNFKAYVAFQKANNQGRVRLLTK